MIEIRTWLNLNNDLEKCKEENKKKDKELTITYSTLILITLFAMYLLNRLI